MSSVSIPDLIDANPFPGLFAKAWSRESIFDFLEMGRLFHKRMKNYLKHRCSVSFRVDSLAKKFQNALDFVGYLAMKLFVKPISTIFFIEYIHCPDIFYLVHHSSSKSQGGVSNRCFACTGR
jgi:hypothetical protein